MKPRVFLLCLVLFALSKCNPVIVIEVAKEGLTTPKTTLIAQHQGIKLDDYNDTLSEYGRQQQYLLGLEMRVRYNNSVFNGECNPLNIFAYSVSKESTMLSGQVQLFGICPLFSNHNITPDMIEKSYPPFDFPAKKQIGEELGLYATPYNFMPLPLHSTYNDPVFGAEESDQYPLPASDLPSSQNEAIIDSTYKKYLYAELAELCGKDPTKASAHVIYDTVHEFLSLVKMKKLRNSKKSLLIDAQNFVFQYYKNYWNKKHRDTYAAMFFNEIVRKLKNAVIIKLNPLLAKPLHLDITIEQPDYDHTKIKYFMFEVGDLQMYTYTNILKFGNENYIPSSSILMFELHKTCELSKDMTLEDAIKCFKLHIKFNDEDVKSRLCTSPCQLDRFFGLTKTHFGNLLKA